MSTATTAEPARRSAPLPEEAPSGEDVPLEEPVCWSIVPQDWASPFEKTRWHVIVLRLYFPVRFSIIGPLLSLEEVLVWCARCVAYRASVSGGCSVG